jgi:hypothetical protein
MLIIGMIGNTDSWLIPLSAKVVNKYNTMQLLNRLLYMYLSETYNHYPLIKGPIFEQKKSPTFKRM